MPQPIQSTPDHQVYSTAELADVRQKPCSLPARSRPDPNEIFIAKLPCRCERCSRTRLGSRPTQIELGISRLA
jgi:hypothetical protein